MQGRARDYWDGFAQALGFTPEQRDVALAEMWEAYCGEANTMLIDYARTLRGRAGLAILSNSAGAARMGIRGVVHEDNATTIAAVEDFLTAAIGS